MSANQKKPLRILLVEDSPDDADLLLHALRADYRVEHTRVETVTALRRELAAGWDVLITDYSLPTMTGLDAIATSKTVAPDLPVLVVSGTIGEDAAVAALHAGADDFIVKGRFARLGPAVERMLRDAAARSARSLAERERAAADERYRSIIEATNEAVWLLDEGGRISFVNGRVADLTGYRSHELVGRPILDLVRPEHRAPFSQLLQAKAALRSDQRELAVQGPDGSERWLLVDTAPFPTPDGRRETLVTAMDVTARRALEEQLRQSQKMEAVGSLAGGIAHDFNNLLSVILSYSTFILEEVPPDHPLRADVEEIRRAGERATALTRQLLAFSRRQLLEPRNIDLREIVLGLERLLRRVLGADLELEIADGPPLGVVRADPNSMEQVLVNLVVNARDAMPEGGKVTLTLANAEVSASDAAAHSDLSPGPYVVLAVTDTGTGMDEPTRKKMFEPFFTTKERGKGTGLGLATVFGIVKQSGGHIRVDTAVGRGTTIEVHLPRVPAAADVLAPPKAPNDKLRGSETILLVEDEEQVRITMRTALRRYGYEVLDAEDGAAALAVSEAFGGRIHVLVTDIVMPRVGGAELAARLGKSRPDMGVLYVSGNTEPSLVLHEPAQARVAFLQKPIVPEMLATKVRELVESV